MKVQLHLVSALPPDRLSLHPSEVCIHVDVNSTDQLFLLHDAGWYDPHQLLGRHSVFEKVLVFCKSCLALWIVSLCFTTTIIIIIFTIIHL